MEDETYALIMHTLTLISVPIHIFGAYCILYITPAKMSNVKSSLLMVHFCSIWLDVFLCLLYTPRFVLPCAAGYPLGILSYSADTTLFLTYINMASVTGLPVAILGFFENRYNYMIVKNKNLYKSGRKLKRIVYMVFNYATCFLYFLPTTLSVPEQETSRLKVVKEFPFITPEILEKPGFLVLSSDSFLLAACVGAMIFSVTSQVLYNFITSLRYFLSQKSKSHATQNAQKKFFAAASIQLIIPLASMVLPAGYITFSLFSGYHNQNLICLSVMIVGAHEVVSSIVMLLIHAPYRCFLFSFCPKWGNEKRVAQNRDAQIVFTQKLTITI